MSRDIKFRVWDTKFLKFSFPEEMDSLIGGYISNPRACRANPKTKPIAAFVLQDLNGRYKLQQFTGLKDKNGKEIYEGDILEGNSIYVCEFSALRKSAGFRMRSLKTGKYYNLYFSFLEIVGNIFENKQLLTEKPELLQ